MSTFDTHSFYTSDELFRWSMRENYLFKRKQDLCDDEVIMVIRWLALSTYDTIIGGGPPVIQKGGINMILTMTLLEAPELYHKLELAQYN